MMNDQQLLRGFKKKNEMKTYTQTLSSIHKKTAT